MCYYGDCGDYGDRGYYYVAIMVIVAIMDVS